MKSGSCLIFTMLLGGACLVNTRTSAQIDLKYEENKTLEWSEIIEAYRGLDENYPEAKLIEAGTTDAGKDLHLFIISAGQQFTPEEVHASGKNIILINNGIHPGESNGIDASIELSSDLLSGKANSAYLENTVILIVPVLNVGGALNRSPFHRANQNGPEEQGFRGNARNLDLNRDFVKMDSKNAMSMARIIQDWDPDIFIDTHSTNGADYPYTLTLISSHPQQLEEPQSSYIKTIMEPALFKAMEDAPYKMCQYVNIFRRSPEQGFEGFYSYPRYLTGYTSSFQILSFTIETHMLKPYPERVQGTKYLLNEILKYTSIHGEDIRAAKLAAIEKALAKSHFVLQWYNDTSQFDLISFSGYKAKTKKSELTGLDMLYYDRDDPWTDFIPFYNYFLPSVEADAPEYYIIPAAWQDVVERLQASNIQMKTFEADTIFDAEAYYIDDFQTTASPYNGHYWHYATKVQSRTQAIRIQQGDYIVPVHQRGSNYLVHTLEPRAYDSYFSWNFFDAVLMRNEYFSPYLFEESALKVLEDNPLLREEFFSKRKSDPDFANNSYAQLSWIYSHSPWSEASYKRYPVFRYTGELNY